jgi:thiosulfate dehydrogenase (quinone) large subunit
MTVHLLDHEAPSTSNLVTATPKEPINRSLPLTAWAIAVIEAILGYEWLLSALNKLFSQDYVRDLSPMLQQMALPGNPNDWWVAFIQQVVLPRTPQWAQLIEVGEFGVALGCFVGAVLWASGRFPRARWARWLNVGVLVALAGGVLLTLNYDWMAGAAFPWVNPSDPFDEGVSLDSVLTGIGVGLFLLHLLTWWTTHRILVRRRQRSAQ